MNRPDKSLEFSAFCRITDRLEKQRGFAIQSYAFLKDVVDDAGRWEKYRDSFAGNVVNLQVVSVHSGLLAYVNRVWDDGKDFQSIPRAIYHLKNCSDEIVEWHCHKSFSIEIIEDISNRLRRKIRRAIASFELLKSSHTLKQARVLRSESYAHLIENSRDRQKLPIGFDPANIKNIHLLKLTKLSIKLSDDLIYIAKMLVSSLEDELTIFRGHCDLYWSGLPVFRDQEAL